MTDSTPFNTVLPPAPLNGSADHGLTEPVSLGDLVEAFELLQEQGALSALADAIDVAMVELLHAHSLDSGWLDVGDPVDVAAVDDPNLLPDDQIEHASDGVGLSSGDRGGLSDLWNRLF